MSMQVRARVRRQRRRDLGPDPSRRQRMRMSLVGVVATLLVALWAALFYLNYWQASMPAFGPVAPHAAALEIVLWRYIAAGALLVTLWGLIVAAMMRAAREHASRRRSRHQEYAESSRSYGGRA